MNQIFDLFFRPRCIITQSACRILFVLLGLVLACSTPAYAQTSPTLAIRLSPSAPQFTDTVTVAATLTGSGGQPTGSVSYTIDGGSAATANIVNGIAYFPIAPLAPGAHTVSVSYGGDGTFGAVSPQSQPFTVTDRPVQINGSSYFQTPYLFVEQGGTFSANGIGGVAVDQNQNVFLAYGNSGSSVAPSVGEITSSLGYKTVPVQGLGTDVRLAVDAAGNLYLADPTNSRVLEYSTGGVQTVLSIAGLMTPASITYDSATQSLFILDSGLGGVIQFNLSTQKQTTIFSGVKSLNAVVATDGAGGVYYATGEQPMFRAADGTVSPIYGQFIPTGIFSNDASVIGLAFDPLRKNLWVATNADGGMSVVRLDAQRHASFLAPPNVSDHGQLALDASGKAYTPSAVYTDGPYAANGGPGVFNQGLSNQPPVATIQLPYGNVGQIGQGGSSPGVYNSVTQTGLTTPSDLPIGFGAISYPFQLTLRDGTAINIPVYGTGYGQWLVSSPGSVVPLTLSVGQPAGIAYGEPYRGYDTYLYVTDKSTSTVKTVHFQYSSSGLNLSGTGTVPFTGLVSPSQLAADGAADVWVMDQGAASGGTRVLRMDTNGVQSVAYSAATGDPLGLIQSVTAFTVDGPEAIYLGGTGKSSGTIVRIDPRGVETQLATGIAAPVVMTIDAASNIYAVDATGTLVSITPLGSVKTIASGLPAPTAISLDASGIVYLSSAAATGVLAIAPDGTQSTISLDGVANPAIAVVDYLGSIHAVDSTTKMTYLDYRSAVQVNFSFGSVGLSTSVTQDYEVTSIGNLPSGSLSKVLNQGTTYAPFSMTPGPKGGCQFADSATPTILSLGQSCQIEFAYAPTKTGKDVASAELDSASVLSTTTVPTGVDWTLNGTASAAGTGAPVPVLMPASLSFGNVAVGSTSSPQTATLSNTGTASLSITSLNLSGAGSSSFTLSSTCGTTLAAGSSCTITLACRPTASGAVSANLTANYPSPLSAQSSALSCTGTTATAAQASLTPPTADFGSVAPGGSSTAQTFTLSNSGNADLSVTSIALTGANADSFKILADSCATTHVTATRGTRLSQPAGARLKPYAIPSLPAGTSCQISVLFEPTASGSVSAALTVVDSAGTQTSTLTGGGTASTSAPQAALTPATANFGSVTSGTTGSTQTFTLTNAGTAVLPISTVSITGTNASAFTIKGATCGNSLAAGASCTVPVTFAPTSTGSLTATLAVTDSEGTQTSALTGTSTASMVATDFTITATPSTQSSYRGASVSYSILVNSAMASSPFTSQVALTATGLPTGASVSFSPASVVPGTTQPTSSMMTVTIPQFSSRNTKPVTPSPFGGLPVGASLASLGFVWLYRKHKKLAHLNILLAVLSLAAIAGTLIGCGSSSTGFATTTSTSTITVTGTNGSVVHSTTVTLTIK